MPEWTEIFEAVGARWRVTRSQAGSLLLAIDLDGRSLKLVVESLPQRSPPAVAVMAEVCAIRHLDPTEALRWNATADHGALAVYRGVYVVRQVLPLETLTRERIDGAIRAAALEAARWARAVVPPPVSVEMSHAVFAHLTH